MVYTVVLNVLWMPTSSLESSNNTWKTRPAWGRGQGKWVKSVEGSRERIGVKRGEMGQDRGDGSRQGRWKTLLYRVHFIILHFVKCNCKSQTWLSKAPGSGYCLYCVDCFTIAVGVTTVSRLAPDWLQAVSRLSPDWLQAGSRLAPDCLQASSRLPPDCLQTGSRLASNWEDCYLTTFGHYNCHDW